MDTESARRYFKRQPKSLKEFSRLIGAVVDVDIFPHGEDVLEEILSHAVEFRV